jgi:lipoprotein-anchoring transpeptidase ErfK/SrfK
MVFRGRRPTGEIPRANAPGRDPVVSRILWLNGRERQNSNTFHRLICIHGTPEASRLGRPASYGGIRMGSGIWLISIAVSARARRSK